jgi:crotonobetainyl-CoA:carnitine CoA-transferase CaiB-like acyl-CoA transferase
MTHQLPAEPFAAATATATGSLAGLKVVDLSRVLAGPYCTQILADHGADVLKIEPPVGDETRGWGPPFDADGTASYFLGLNRNKRGTTMDLTQPAAREALLAMVAQADVLVENFKTGTMEKWGLGPEVLTARFPQLVYARVTGFGADGPMGGLPGYDAAIQALVGLMSVNGEPDARGGEPLRVGLPVVDMVTGLNATLGILMALQERSRSGKGQYLEVALYDAGLSLLHPHAANHLLDGRIPGRTGNAHPNICPYDTFVTGTEKIFLAVGNDKQRSVNRVVLKERLEAALAAFECKPLAERLVREGVPCAPIVDVAQALADPHTQHRGMVVQIDGYRGVASPIKLSRTPASYRRAPPKRQA